MPEDDENANVWMTFLRELEPRVEEIEVDGKKIKRLVFEKHFNAERIIFPQTYENKEAVLEYYDKETGLKWVGKFPFKYAVFRKGASFTGATFEGIVSFYGAIFEGDANFYNTTFEGYVSFDHVTFTGLARFKETKFKNSVELINPDEIYEQILFRKEVSNDLRVGHGDPTKPNVNDFWKFSATFIHATFNESITFKDAEFYGAVRFSSSNFGHHTDTESIVDKADFEGTKFKGPETDFANCHFYYTAWFIGATFGGYVTFNNSIFERLAEFDRAKFLVDADGRVMGRLGNFLIDFPLDFREIQFKDDASFSSVTFYSKPNFSGTHFKGSVMFTKSINSNECTFHQGADFTECVFERAAHFRGSIFHKSNVNEYPQTSFIHSTFKDTPIFIGAKFGKVFFNFAVFEKGSSFNNATFHDEAWFREVEFKKTVEFKATEFRGNVWFDGSVFERLIIFVEDPRNKNKETTTKYLQLPKFWKGLSFSNCDFKQGVKLIADERDYEKDNLNRLGYVRHLIRSALALENPLSRRFLLMFTRKEKDTTYYLAIKEAARVQRLSFEKEGKREEADRMFVLEMRAKRRARLKNARGKLGKSKAHVHNFVEWLLADLPSRYGTDWVRLFMMSLLVVIGNAVPYTIWGHYIDGFPSNAGYLARFANALYYSLVTFTTLGYGDMHPTGWLKALSATEALTGAVFMALIVAVIARKWMR